MKERGIIFNAEMVRAVLDGRKTQTRIPIKPQPPEKGKELSVGHGCPPIPHDWSHWKDDLPCVPGDQIWVRETWAKWDENQDESPCYNTAHAVCYKATQEFAGSIANVKWRPSVHMQRWASRITLEITNVRVERLQDIFDNHDDVLAEGIQPKQWTEEHDGGTVHLTNGFELFETLWDSIYKEKGFSWYENPFVWVLEFKRIDK